MRIKRILANIKALFLYPKINLALSRKRKLYFFFPYWSFGGAERVHIDIMQLFKEQKPICFVTMHSINSGFKAEMKAIAEVINLGRWGEKRTYRAHLLKKMAKSINKQHNPIIFGWCSGFMYDLIPHLAPHVKIIDLTHNFTENITGIEWYSLPCIPRIDKRIVVSKSIMQQFRDLYQTNNIDPKYLERIEVIQNKIPFEPITITEKNYLGDLTVLFVARNSEEKRAHLFIEVAKLCYEQNYPINFEMIGDFNDYKDAVSPNLKIIGAIHNKNILNEYYKKAHILLLTSIRESWGLVIFEGMNYGVVPISTNVGELSDYISASKKNGILIDSLEDDAHLVSLFFEQVVFMHNDRLKLNQFSINAYNTVKELSDGCRFSSSYKTLINNYS